MLDQTQIEAYRKNGFLICESFFSAGEIAAVAGEANALSERADLIHSDNIRCRWQSHIETGDPILDTLDPVTNVSAVILKLATSKRLSKLVEELLGERAFLFKDKLIFKPPGALGHAPHQDFISWPLFPKTFTTVLVAIDGATSLNGCLSAFRGHHARGYLSAHDGDYYDLPESIFEKESQVELNLNPGDIAVL